MKDVGNYFMVFFIWVLGMIVLAPCMLTFTEGADGGLTWANGVGIAYSVVLVGAVYKWLEHGENQNKEDARKYER